MVRRTFIVFGINPYLFQTRGDACIFLTNHVVPQRLAVETSQSDSRRRATYPIGNLLPALQRCAAYAFTTCGVEQSFAQCKLLLGEQRGCCDHGLLNDELQIISYVDRAYDDAIIRRAREEWAAIYGTARAVARRERCDKGIARGALKTARTTEKAWIEQRRASVSDLVSSGSVSTSTSSPVDGTINAAAERTAERTWSARHEKEQDFQLAKQIKNFMASMEANHVLPSEITDEHIVAFADFQEKQAKNGRAYNTKKKKCMEALTVAIRPIVGRQTVFLDCDLRVPASHFADGLRALNFQRVHDRHRARVFIVENIDHFGQHTKWAAVLNGGWIATVDYILNGGSGAALKYKRALSSKRAVWCSPAFKARHAEVHKVIASSMLASTSHKWSWIDTKDAAILIGKRRARSGNDGEIMALVTGEEQRHDQDAALHQMCACVCMCTPAHTHTCMDARAYKCAMQNTSAHEHTARRTSD